MERFGKENATSAKDVPNEAESANTFGKSEIVLLNLIAEIIVEILMQEGDEGE